MKKITLLSFASLLAFCVHAQVENHLKNNNGTDETLFRVTNSNSLSGGFQLGINSNNSGFLNLEENQFLFFGTNNIERVRILSTGQLGINTSAPTEFLDVNGNGRFRLITSGINDFITTHDNSGTLHQIAFTGDNNDVLLGDGTFGPTPSSGIADGNGIYSGNGTVPFATRANLTSQLIFNTSTLLGGIVLNETSGSLPNSFTLATGGAVGITGISRLQLGVANGNGQFHPGTLLNDGIIELNTRLSISAGGGTAQHLLLDTDGDLSIGAGIPTAKLDIEGDVRVATLNNNDALDQVVVRDPVTQILHFRDAASLPSAGGSGIYGGGGTVPSVTRANLTNQLIFNTSTSLGGIVLNETSGSLPNSFTLATGGAVGITGISRLQLGVANGNGQFHPGTLLNDGIIELNTRLSISAGGGTAQHLLLDTDGDLSIGAGIPTAKLDIEGDVRVATLNNNDALDQVVVRDPVTQILHFRSAASLCCTNNQATIVTDLEERIATLEKRLEEANLIAVKPLNSTDDLNSIGQTIELKNPNAIILDQNLPNPFQEKTVINYTIPENVSEVKLLFYNLNGIVLKQVDINERGEGSLTVYGRDLEKGVYTYSLIADGELIATKKMIKQ